LRIDVGDEGKEECSQGIKSAPYLKGDEASNFESNCRELLKRQEAIAIETMGKQGMDEHIKQFPWPTKNIVNH
jgi:hypothetical protein